MIINFEIECTNVIVYKTFINFIYNIRIKYNVRKKYIVKIWKISYNEYTEKEKWDGSRNVGLRHWIKSVPLYMYVSCNISEYSPRLMGRRQMRHDALSPRKRRNRGFRSGQSPATVPLHGNASTPTFLRRIELKSLFVLLSLFKG